eukprot:CAMPEP_0172925012 /NCGR_PEP_ID=MMETSP1075-20121228/212848_1 /TAXON_ID=2916 /ORGANISM="Ceratium fusus, Strain PA161109" /LENGTH=153 /DNA_ID=CAMNT_0013785793 /DNA_START=398 /DNA_END=859 /DNA_ORIENTATION=-
MKNGQRTLQKPVRQPRVPKPPWQGSAWNPGMREQDSPTKRNATLTGAFAAVGNEPVLLFQPPGWRQAQHGRPQACGHAGCLKTSVSTMMSKMPRFVDANIFGESPGAPVIVVASQAGEFCRQLAVKTLRGPREPANVQHPPAAFCQVATHGTN